MTEYITNPFSSWPRPAAVIYLHSCGTNKNGWLLTEGHLPRVQCVSLSQSACLWLLLCFCSGGYVRVGFCICPPVRVSQVPLPLWCVSEVTWPQEAQSLRWRQCQKWHCDSRHGNKCWHLILGDCNWSCRFGYNFVLLCQGTVGSEVRLNALAVEWFVERGMFRSSLTLPFFPKESFSSMFPCFCHASGEIIGCNWVVCPCSLSFRGSLFLFFFPQSWWWWWWWNWLLNVGPAVLVDIIS